MSTAVLGLGLGFAVGGLGGMFGVGGGILAIPMLGLLFHMDQHVAQGSSLVMILPNTLLGFWKYRQRNTIDLRMAGLLAVTAVLFTYLAARIANMTPSITVRHAFAVFLAIVAIYLAWKVIGGKESKSARQVHWCWSWLVRMTGGLLSGLFGVGGATIAPPALTTFFGLSQTAAQGLALAMIIPGTIAALVVYSQAGTVDWTIGIAMAVGGLLAVPLGVAAAHKITDGKLKLFFCLIVIITAISLFAADQ
jgi:uncharacterized membrane protein YfcA